MPEPAPSAFPANAADHRAPPLTQSEIEAVLADFRSWLEAQTAEPVVETEAIDLQVLLGQFTALRHEVNLQTRAVRAQQEQNADALRQFGDALEALRNDQPEFSEQPGDEQVRSCLTTLVDLYDALTLARREVQRVRETALPLLDRLAENGTALPQVSAAKGRLPPSPPAQARSFWARWFAAVPTSDRAPGLRAPEERQEEMRQIAARSREFLASVLTGYTMSVQRLERALQQYDLEPIPAVGQPFEPELMEVLEVVHNTGRPVNEVHEEVRRGYRWRGRVFRYAQVRVAKS